MTTPSELKENLVKQYNELVVTIQQLQGAIQACDALMEEQETSEEDEE
jgi:hypothetical protein